MYLPLNIIILKVKCILNTILKTKDYRLTIQFDLIEDFAISQPSFFLFIFSSKFDSPLVFLNFFKKSQNIHQSW